MTSTLIKSDPNIKAMRCPYPEDCRNGPTDRNSGGWAALALALVLFAQPIWAGTKPTEVKFRGHMCADVPFTVTLNGVAVNGNGQGCLFYSDTPWGTTKLLPDQTYTVSTGGAICSAHIQFEKSCYKLFVKGDNYTAWTEVSQIDKNETAGPDGGNKDAGGTWQIILTNKAQPTFGSGSTQLGSVAVRLSLGNTASGNPAGSLILETENMDAGTSTLATLRQVILSDEVEVLQSGGSLRQIFSWDGLVDAVAISGGYELRFYSLADVGSKDGNGFYQIDAGASPLRTWSIVNPDQGTATNRLAVGETVPGQPVALTTYAQQTGTWSMGKSVGGQTRSLITKTAETVNGEPVEVLTDQNYSSAAMSETTITRTYTDQASAHLANKLQSVEYPDGRRDSSTYDLGTYNASTRNFTPGAGTFLRGMVTHGMVAAPGILSGKSTRDVTITDANESVLLEQLHVAQGTSFVLVSQTWHVYDAEGHLTETLKDGRTIYNATWQDGQMDSATDETGTAMFFYYYDLEGRSLYDVKEGVAAAGNYAEQPEIATYRDYDFASGGVGSEYTSAGDLSTYLWNTYEYVGGGNSRLQYEYRNGLTTSYSYAPSVSGGLIITITHPGGGTEIRAEDADGRLISITGTSVIAEYHTHGTDTGGNEWSQVNYASANSPNYVKTTTDWLGRVIREERPAFAGLSVREYYYNARGQLWKETTTGLADRLYEYDELGSLTRTGLDLDGNGALDLASMDRIEESITTYEQAGADWYRVATRKNYLTDNNAAATTSMEKERLTLPGNLLRELRTLDEAGNETVATSTVDRASKLVTETVLVPGSTTPAVTVIRNGLVQSTSTPTVAAPMTFTYDALGRRTSTTDPRINSTVSLTFEEVAGYTTNRVATVMGGGQTVTNIYDSEGENPSGRLLSRTVNGRTTRFAYSERGQATRTWGDGTYPVQQEYDALGRLWKLHTYRVEAGWNAATWPTEAGEGDVTTWNYQESTGLLLSKADSAGKSVSYTYKPFGRIETRTWARGVSTTYSYTLAGDLHGMDYNDTTPDVTMMPDRAGRVQTLNDAAGTHTMGYTLRGQLASDAIGASGILASVTVTTGYDALFRKQTLTASVGSSPVLTHTLGYDPATGRLASVGNDTVSAAYGYLPNSDWQQTTNLKRGTTTVLTTTRTPDDFDRLLSVTHAVTGQPASGSGLMYQFHSRPTGFLVEG